MPVLRPTSPAPADDRRTDGEQKSRKSDIAERYQSF